MGTWVRVCPWPMGDCQQVVARTNKECVGLHQTTSSGCDVAPVIEVPCWKKHETVNTKYMMTYIIEGGS